MATDLLGLVIVFFKINCNIIDCYTTQPFEAMFYLIFFPTVFILLFIYILSNFIFRDPGTQAKGLRLLVSVAIYMFIVIGGWYSLFVVVSRVWWLVIIILVGFWIFVGHFTGKGGGGRGAMPSARKERSLIAHLTANARKKLHDAAIKNLGLETSEEKIKRKTKMKIDEILAKREAGGVDALEDDEKLIYLAALGVTAKQGDDLDRAIEKAEKSKN